jgi:hypothetical protein
MKKSLLTLLVIQLFLEINCYVPYINACFDNKKVLKDSLTLLRASVYNKNRWEPPVGYIPDKHKKVKWEPPVGYIPDRLRNQDIINEKENIEIEIDKILIKIEKIKKNVKNIKKYNKNEY